MPASTRSGRLWDVLGAMGAAVTGILSAGCALHCAATPLLSALVPLALPHLHVSKTVEQGVIVASLLLATLRLVTSFRRHNCRQPLWLLAGGALSFGVGQTGETPWWGLLGGLLIGAAHLANLGADRRFSHR